MGYDPGSDIGYKAVPALKWNFGTPVIGPAGGPVPTHRPGGWSLGSSGPAGGPVPVSFPGAPIPVQGGGLSFGLPPVANTFLGSLFGGGGSAPATMEIKSPIFHRPGGWSLAPVPTVPGGEVTTGAVDGSTKFGALLGNLTDAIFSKIGATGDQATTDIVPASWGSAPASGTSAATIAMVLAAAGVAYLLVSK